MNGLLMKKYIEKYKVIFFYLLFYKEIKFENFLNINKIEFLIGCK